MVPEGKTDLISIDSVSNNRCVSLQALTLPPTHQKGKLLALRLICILVARPHDLQLPRNQLLQFYRTIHNGLIGDDQV